MSRKIFSILFSFTLFFNACTSKITYKDDITYINKFFTDKEKKYFIFFDNKYTYLIDNQESVKTVKDIFYIANTFHNYKIAKSNYLPHINLLDDNKAEIIINIQVKSPTSKELIFLKNKDFYYNKRVNLYTQAFTFYAKYTTTGSKLKQKYQTNHLKNTIKFHRQDRKKHTTKYKSHIKESTLSLAGGILFLGIGLPVMLTVALLTGPNCCK